MRNKPSTPKIKIDKEECINMINSFNEQLSAENDEITAEIEKLKKQNSAIKKNYAEMLAETNKLLDSIAELALLTE
jgi:cell division protein FtsB